MLLRSMDNFNAIISSPYGAQGGTIIRAEGLPDNKTAKQIAGMLLGLAPTWQEDIQTNQTYLLV